MNPTEQTIFELFEKQGIFTVPLFQRAYVWTQEEQWEPLWEDIERQAVSCLKALLQNDDVRTNHFLGALVIDRQKIHGRGLTQAQVIDGQQRLITLQVFLAALRDFSKTMKDDAGVRPEAERLTINNGNFDEAREEFKLWPTNSDRDLFSIVLKAGSPENLYNNISKYKESSTEPYPKLVAAYKYFYEAIENFVKGYEFNGYDQSVVHTTEVTESDRIFSIFQALRISLKVVVIELEDKDDPQIIFETLNARGQPLLPSDLIRNTVFLDATNKKLDVENLYDKYWQQFDSLRVEGPVKGGEDRFWHQLERQGRINRPRIDLFIFHDLVVRTEKELSIGQLFREFRQWYTRTNVKTEEYLYSLKKYSDNFSSLIIPKGGDRLSLFARRLRSLDTSTVYPILLFLMDQKTDKLNILARDKIIEYIESYLVRRFVCGYSAQNYNRFFLSLLRKMKKASDEEQDLVNVICVELLRSDEVTAIWPSDSTFKNGWLERKLYVQSRPDRSGMILRALDEALHTNRHENISLPDNLTVEHLLPQRWRENYPLNIEDKETISESAELERENLIHTVGNLTLLTNPLNAAISNGSFDVKSRTIAQESDLRINSFLREKQWDKWDEKDIKQRGNQLFEKAKIIWSRPQK